MWLEHTDRAVVYKPQTVFQPVMKKKKSVNKLTSADDIKGASKYCLVTQEPDSEGDIETRLYKVRNGECENSPKTIRLLMLNALITK